MIKKKKLSKTLTKILINNKLYKYKIMHNKYNYLHLILF